MLSRNFSASIKISKHLNNTSTHHKFFNVIGTIGNWVCLNKMLVYVVISQQLLGKSVCGLVCLSSTNNSFCWLYTCVCLPLHTTFHWAQLIQNSSIRLKILHWSNCVLNFWCIESNVESVFAPWSSFPDIYRDIFKCSLCENNFTVYLLRQIKNRKYLNEISK